VDLSTVYTETKLSSLNGEAIELPLRISWKKERGILRVLSSIYKKAPFIEDFLKKAFVGTKEKINPADTINCVPQLLEEVPGDVTEIVSILIDKDSTWIDNNLDLEIIVRIVSPFLSFIFRKVMSVKKTTQEKINLQQKNT